MSSIGQKIRQAVLKELEHRGLRRVHYAEIVEGVGQAMIYRWLDGDTDMSLDRIEKCLKPLGITLKIEPKRRRKRSNK
ncbi:MAG: helix-turn-helix transcriptional regulator [Sedimentisphaerales bacterium]|nr:helix-turn-helix transcriptional regulator [Sedimentisphaerales bacterium]